MIKTLLLLLPLLCSAAGITHGPRDEEKSGRFFLEGSLREMNGQRELALEFYSRSLAADSSCLSCAHAVFELAFAEGHRALMQASGHQIVLDEPDSPNARAYMAILLQLNELAEFDQLLASSPDSLYLVHRLGRSWDKREMGRLSFYLSKALELDLAAFRQLGGAGEALRPLLRHLARAPELPIDLPSGLEQSPWVQTSLTGQLLLAEIALDRRDTSALGKAVASCLELDSMNIDARVLLANGLVLEDRPEEVLALCLEGLTIDPQRMELLEMAAWAGERLGRLDFSDEMLMTMASLMPQDEDIWLGWSAFCDRHGMKGRSVEILSEAYRVFGDVASPTLKNNLAYSQANSELTEEPARLDFALQLAEEAVSAEPANPAFRDTLGWIYHLRGRYSEAEVEYLKAYDLFMGDPDPELLEHLGELRFLQGDLKAAMAWWESSLEKNPENERLRLKLQIYQPEFGGE